MSIIGEEGVAGATDSSPVDTQNQNVNQTAGQAPVPPTSGEGQPEGTSQEPKWLQNVPKALVREEMKKYKSVWDYMQDIWKQLEGLQKEVESRKSYVRPLGPDATAEEIKAFMQAMGIPESPDEYEVPVDDPDIAETTRKIASKLFLTKQQAQELAKTFYEEYQESEKEEAELRQKELDAIASEVKSLYPNDWNDRVKKTNTILRNYFGEEGMKYIAETGLGNKSWFVKGCLKMTEQLSEGRLPAGSASGNPYGIDLDELYPSMRGLKKK